jgi:sulfide:quinone oxidoreductase
MSAKAKVLILGGGFAGLEATFYLRYKLKEKVDLVLVSERDYFIFKPNTIYIPFGEEPEKFYVNLDKPTKKKGIEFVEGVAGDIDPERRTVSVEGKTHEYDYLVVATGAAMRAEEIPGLAEHAVTLWTADDMLRLREGLAGVAERAAEGERQRILFLVPPNNRCSGPLYEIVLMTDTWLQRKKIRDKIEMTWTTFEEGYIQAFGPRLNTVVTNEFAERNIAGHKGYIVTEVTPGEVRFQNGERFPYDLLVSFPPYIARQRYGALPSDDRGFVHVEPDSRRVQGHANIFVVGDAADFPIKQAFLALLQADAAASHLEAEINGEKPEVDFEPMSLCVMEELNRATFASVPLTYTGDPMKPVTVDEEGGAAYRVGVSPMWRLGKKILGIYVPWRFGSGEPFHAGFAWDAMDLGLKVMSKILAR